jgi:VTC domain
MGISSVEKSTGIIIEPKDRISSEISQLNGASLVELERIRLLNRYDFKYVVNTTIIPDIIKEIQRVYKVLDINDKRIFGYDNLYYDTDDLALYRSHHNGKLNRYKVRFRNYLGSNICFFELKYKNNKSKTLKFRLEQDGIMNSLDEATSNFLYEMNIDPKSLQPKLQTMYNRITLFNEEAEEKVTIDTDLYFKNCKHDYTLNNLSIIEVKLPIKSGNSYFARLLKRRGHRRVSFSKYCAGIILTKQQAKYNRFKSVFHVINNKVSGFDGFKHLDWD